MRLYFATRLINFFSVAVIMDLSLAFTVWVLLPQSGDGWTDSMEQSPSSQANSHSASQEIPRVSWNPKIHYHVHKSLPLVPILNGVN
jgi:hypothetical protein